MNLFAVQMRLEKLARESTKVIPIPTQKMAEGLMQFPTMQLDLTTAQMLMDELWNCGIRPSRIIAQCQKRHHKI